MKRRAMRGRVRLRSGLRSWLLAACFGLALLGPAAAQAPDGAAVSVCFNYGCVSQAEAVFSPEQLGEIAILLRADDAAGERVQLALALGRLYAWAGEQTPIAADKGGNLADEAVYGRMDCIDHSTTSTRFLRLLEARGQLRFHAVDEPVLRSRMLIFDHYAAQIVEIGPARAALAEGGAADVGGNEQGAARFAVDSWFFDNGQAAAILPLADWKAGGGPDVGL